MLGPHPAAVGPHCLAPRSRAASWPCLLGCAWAGGLLLWLHILCLWAVHNTWCSCTGVVGAGGTAKKPRKQKKEKVWNQQRGSTGSTVGWGRRVRGVQQILHAGTGLQWSGWHCHPCQPRLEFWRRACFCSFTHALGAACVCVQDPNAPKRATTAFFYFSQDQRGVGAAAGCWLIQLPASGRWLAPACLWPRLLPPAGQGHS